MAKVFSLEIYCFWNCMLLTHAAQCAQDELKRQQKVSGDLEQEVKKLSGQQNLQQRIKHHAKIKVVNDPPYDGRNPDNYFLL